jgi:Rap1a immunity proteins
LRRKRCGGPVAIILAASLFAPIVRAGPQDATARALLADWRDQDPGMRAVAEVIASAFASGLAAAGSLGGREVVCLPSDLRGKQIMSALEKFVGDNPDLADKPYGVAMAASLSRAFPCAVKS